MSRAVLCAVLLGFAAGFRSKPVVTQVAVDKTSPALEELKREEYELVDKLFTSARDMILTEVSKARTTVAVAKAAPAGAPAAAKPPFGMPKKAYLGIKPDMKAKVEPLFQLSCAETLETMVIKRQNHLAHVGLSNESIGIDMSTHFQVQCPGSIPMPEDKCDEYATSLAKMIDAGHPIFIPPPAGPAGAPGAPGAAPGAAPAFLEISAPRTVGAAPAGAPGAPGAPGAGGIKSGNDWCKAFFGEFFDAIVAQVAAAGPAGAPGGAPAM